MLPVQEAISLIERHSGKRFIRRQRVWNEDTNRDETAYFFEHCCFDCIGQLRFYGEQAKYTMGL